MAMQVSEAVFRIAYDGEAVRDGEMEVSDLAPALLGIAQMLKAAGTVLEGEQSQVSVKVKSTREGSFEVWLTVAVEAGKGAWAFWKNPEVQAAAQLAQVIGLSGIGVGTGAIEIVRKLKGRKPKAVVEASPGMVSLEVDGVMLEVPEISARVALDPAFRSALEKVISDPLDKDGFDVVMIGPQSGASRIEKTEADYYRAPGNNQADEFVSRHTKAFSIVSLSFKPGQKWKLSDGGAIRHVKMSDRDFGGRVDRSEVAFAKGDILVCEVVETSRRTESGFKSDYEIVKVVDHRKATPEPPLDFG